MRLEILLLTLSLLGCSDRLTVRQDWVSEKDRAAAKIHISEPERDSGPRQQLVVSWSVPVEEVGPGGLTLLVTVRTHPYAQESISQQLYHSLGTIAIDFPNHDLVTYQAKLVSGDQVLATWTHQIWTDLIDIK